MIQTPLARGSLSHTKAGRSEVQTPSHIRYRLVTETFVVWFERMPYQVTMKSMYPDFPGACGLTLKMPRRHWKVVGLGFRIVGYVNKEGRLQQHFDNAFLENVIDWYSLK